MRLEPEGGERERARASEARAQPEVGFSPRASGAGVYGEGPPPFPSPPWASDPDPAWSGGERGGGRWGGAALNSPMCGPRFGVGRLNLFRVGGREANGPMGS